MPELEFEVAGVQDFRNVARVLGRENRRLPKEIYNTIFRESKVLAKEAAAKVRAIPVEGTKHTGLRKEIAEGIQIAGVVDKDGGRGVRVITTMAEDDEVYLPRGFDSRKGWQHPTFGNREKWVRQYNPGNYSWFMETMSDGQLPIALKIHQHIQDAIDEIDKAGSAG
jgi:hypothetical protein